MWYGRHPEEPYVLVAQQSLIDPTRAPDEQQTLWAYCHVPHGSTVDMTERIEAQIERFAPGFRDLILARQSIRPRRCTLQSQLHRRRHQRRRPGPGPALDPSRPALVALQHAPGRRLSLLVGHTARRRRSRHVRLPRRAGGSLRFLLTVHKRSAQFDRRPVLGFRNFDRLSPSRRYQRDLRPRSLRVFR